MRSLETDALKHTGTNMTQLAKFLNNFKNEKLWQRDTPVDAEMRARVMN